MMLCGVYYELTDIWLLASSLPLLGIEPRMNCIDRNNDKGGNIVVMREFLKRLIQSMTYSPLFLEM